MGQEPEQEDVKLLNVRASRELRELVARAASVSEAKDKSHWMREALQAAATREIAQHERRSRQERGPLGSLREHTLGYVEPRHETGCTHPPTARWRGIRSETCLSCGKEWPR